jgi:hypothetical protein
MMIMNKIHKLRKIRVQEFAFTECSIPLHLNGGKAHKIWKYVTCKKCLKKKLVK